MVVTIRVSIAAMPYISLYASLLRLCGALDSGRRHSHLDSSKVSLRNVSIHLCHAADEDQGRSWRDSLPVPELPTMDVSEFEALETEALKYSSKGRRSVSVDPSVASPALQAAAKTSSPNVHVPEASGTPPGDVPKPEMCNSPSLDGPTVCASPRVLGGTAERLKTKGGSRKSSQNHSAAPGSAVAATADSSEADKLAADSKEMAIKHALVNQSLTGVINHCMYSVLLQYIEAMGRKVRQRSSLIRIFCVQVKQYLSVVRVQCKTLSLRVCHVQ